MTGGLKRFRRRSVYSALVVGLVALAIPISYALAGTGSRVTVPVQRYDGSCNPASAKKKVVGSATLERTKSGSVIVTYTVTGATPTGTYYVYLFSDTPVPCAYYYYAKMKVDSSGNGSTKFEVPGLGGYTDFWVWASGGEYDRTPVVHI